MSRRIRGTAVGVVELDVIAKLVRQPQAVPAVGVRPGLQAQVLGA
jgi:hypothetical protein